MGKHNLVLKEKSTGMVYYMPTDLEVYGTLLTILGTDMENILRNELEDEYDIIGEVYK